MNSKKRKNILLAVFVLFLIIILAGLSYIIFVLYNNYTANREYEEIRSTAGSQENTNATEFKTDLTENPIDFDALTDVNDEVYAWINVPGTNVDYPILQSKTSDFFYIDHDIYKQYKFAGSIYTEACNLKDFSDRNTVLYGHNMADKSMFATLHKFEDKSFFDTNRYIYIYLPQRRLTYEIVSAYTYDDRHIINSFNFSEDDVFKEYLKTVKNPRSSVKNVWEEANLDLNSKLITLSTCLDADDSGRYLVQGVLIKNEQTISRK